jgi:hypothetical protein
MNVDDLYRRYQELQEYVGWTPDDAQRVQSVAGLLEPFLAPLVEDFYQEIQRHPEAKKVLTGGAVQIEQLKQTLVDWLHGLLSGCYDRDYVVRRWHAGKRHAEIGLDQVYPTVAMSRLRRGLLIALREVWRGSPSEALVVRLALNTLLDLDLAIIVEAYQTEYAERSLRREREFSDNLIETAQAVVLLLGPDGRIVRFNRYTENLLGYRLNEVQGQDWIERFIPPDDRPRVREVLEQALAGGDTSGTVSVLLTRDGQPRYLQWSNQVLRDAGGQVIGVLGIGQDITSLKEAQQRALQAERLAAIGEMMTGLAHESGNALARSQACLEMLTFEVQDRPEALDLIDRIQKAQDHLRQLYEEVRGYATPLRLAIEPWDVSAVWRQAWDNLTLLREGKDVALHEETGGINLECPVDPFRLGQVFRNIFENSLAACAPPVRIDVLCTEARLEGKPALRIVVRDNGPGLNAEQARRIFEPFFTTKTKGTGLGMAIARRIIEAHGGQIAVGSGTGRGAEIVITLLREGV